MPAFLYDVIRINLMGNTTAHARVDLDTDSFAVFFVDEADDAPTQATDQDVADRLAAAQVPSFATAPSLAGMAVTTDTNVAKFDATDLVFTALSGDPVESLDLFKDTGTDTTSVLVSNHDDYTGLPLTPSGTDVTIVWPATGIIRI